MSWGIARRVGNNASRVPRGTEAERHAYKPRASGRALIRIDIAATTRPTNAGMAPARIRSSPSPGWVAQHLLIDLKRAAYRV
ncbi:MAG TPA: hypothetical protein VHR39_10795 [Propionibacteriaceae bacterium]|nr:hypothetical protein [Propionibacteriaceae bacterium]